MNAIVEKGLSTNCRHFNYPYEKISELNRQFVEILNEITKSINEGDLRNNIAKLPKYKHFLIGFGGGHMWVKQLINGEAKQQVIFVRFE